MTNIISGNLKMNFTGQRPIRSLAVLVLIAILVTIAQDYMRSLLNRSALPMKAVWTDPGSLIIFTFQPFLLTFKLLYAGYPVCILFYYSIFYSCIPSIRNNW